MARVFASLAVVTAIAVVVVNAFSPEPSIEPAAAPFFLAGVFAPALVGLFVAGRAPRVGWILLAGALSVALVMLGDGVTGLHDARWAATLAAPWPVLFLWPLALAFVFPDGALPSPRWRPVAAFAVAVSAGIVVLLLLHAAVGIGDWALPLFWFCWAGLLASLFAGAACAGRALPGGGRAAAPPGRLARLRRAADSAVARRDVAAARSAPTS